MFYVQHFNQTLSQVALSEAARAHALNLVAQYPRMTTLVNPQGVVDLFQWCDRFCPDDRRYADARRAVARVPHFHLPESTCSTSR